MPEETAHEQLAALAEHVRSELCELPPLVEHAEVAECVHLAHYHLGVACDGRIGVARRRSALLAANFYASSARSVCISEGALAFDVDDQARALKVLRMLRLLEDSTEQRLAVPVADVPTSTLTQSDLDKITCPKCRRERMANELAVHYWSCGCAVEVLLRPFEIMIHSPGREVRQETGWVATGRYSLRERPLRVEAAAQDAALDTWRKTARHAIDLHRSRG